MYLQSRAWQHLRQRFKSWRMKIQPAVQTILYGATSLSSIATMASEIVLLHTYPAHTTTTAWLGQNTISRLFKTPLTSRAVGYNIDQILLCWFSSSHYHLSRSLASKHKCTFIIKAHKHIRQQSAKSTDFGWTSQLFNVYGGLLTQHPILLFSVKDKLLSEESGCSFYSSY